ncbi:MAG: HD domain-containing protein [Chloroflexota bacterium]|nr:MAG: HD domain-containing protein [Chloroflexota bacterium]
MPSRGDDLNLYRGRWVALVGDRVVGQGGSPEQALRAAKASRPKDTPKVIYVQPYQPFVFTDLMQRVAQALPEQSGSNPVYLVGGAVRDAMSGRDVHDMDFALSGDVLKIARKVANRIGAAYYPLDEERLTARLVLIPREGPRKILDFAAIRGPDLESDLRARDFTINAMAVEIHQPQALIDPLGGAPDLRAKLLRACSPASFIDDPLRILRGIRQAAAYRLHIAPDTRKLMRESVSRLPQVSSERLRDEIFRILEGEQPATSLRALEMLGVFKYVLTELSGLKGVQQSAPHVLDVWGHTLDVVDKLDVVLQALAPQYNEEASANLSMGLVSVQLGRFREKIGEHLAASLNPERSLRGLLMLAALYHDAGKPQTRHEEEGGRVRFIGHESEGATIVSERGQALKLSNVEVDRLRTIVANHLRPILLAQAAQEPTRKAIYRFFRDTGPAGVDVCLLSLADLLGVYGVTLPTEVWAKHLEVVRKLFEAWWEHPEESVSPPALLNGNELMEALSLRPGPKVGQLLEAIREAQATGQVQTREAALSLAESILSSYG